jgi:hypothetical protein
VKKEREKEAFQMQFKHFNLLNYIEARDGTGPQLKSQGQGKVGGAQPIPPDIAVS